MDNNEIVINGKKLYDTLISHALWFNSEGEEGVLANFDGENLSGANLSYVNLRSARFVNSDLRNVNMYHSDISFADFEGSDLSGSNLSYSDFHKANLRNADLRNAELFGCDFRGANLIGANLIGANIDYSCWPLWCGSNNVKVDVKIAAQLAAHFCALDCDDPAFLDAREKLLAFARKSHRASDLNI